MSRSFPGATGILATDQYLKSNLIYKLKQDEMCYLVTSKVPLQCGEKIRDLESTVPVSAEGRGSRDEKRDVSSREASDEWEQDHT